MLEVGQVVEVSISPSNVKHLAYVYSYYIDDMNIERVCFKKLDKHLNKTEEILEVFEFDTVYFLTENSNEATNSYCP